MGHEQCDQIVSTLAKNEGIFSIGQNIYPTLSFLYAIVANFKCCKWQKWKKNLAIWSHWS